MSGTAGFRRGGEADGRTRARYRNVQRERKKGKEERVDDGGRREGEGGGAGALERRYRYGIMKTRMYF